MVRRTVVALLCVVAGAYAHHIGRLVAHAPAGGLGTAVVPASLEAWEAARARPGSLRTPQGARIGAAHGHPNGVELAGTMM